MVRSLIRCALLFALPWLSLLSCADQGTAPDYSGIANPEKRWAAYQLHDYTIAQYRTCFCVDGGKRHLITVRHGNIAGVSDQASGRDVPRDQWGRFKTVGELFSLVNSIDPAGVASLQVTYDVKFGIPVRVFIDPSVSIADEEYGFETELVMPQFN